MNSLVQKHECSLGVRYCVDAEDAEESWIDIVGTGRSMKRFNAAEQLQNCQGG